MELPELLSRENHAPFLMKVATAICLFSVFFNSIMKTALAEDLPAEVTVRLLGPDNNPLAPGKVPSVKKSADEWLKQLGPERFQFSAPKGPSGRSAGRSWTIRRRASTFVRAAICLCLAPRQSSNPARGGPAFSSPSRGKMSLRSRIEVMEWSARKFVVAAVTDIWGTSFPMARRRPVSVTA